MAIPAGTRLGHFDIVATIGAGGMGEVYKARDTRLDRTVAIKVLPQHLADKPDLRERFEREARTIAGLNHPHICTLYDVGHQDGIDFLVMEYLEGETLATHLLKGPLPLEQVLRYGAEIADAIAAAHGRNITHRDLKPGNVMLTKSGIKVLDFGLAKAAADGRTLTVTDAVMGTLAYMAPEQLEGHECDARTDIYALGLVFYEMVTGKRAARGQVSAMGYLPEKFAHVVERCLAHDPDERWQTARDLKAELLWVAKPPSRSEAVPEQRTRNSVPFYAAGMLLLAVAIVAGTWIAIAYRARGTNGGASLPIDTSLLTIASYTGTERSGAISPDGKFFAFVSNRGGSPDIWVRQISGGEPVQITHDAVREQDLVYASNGESIYYSTAGAQPTIFRVGVLGGTPRKVVSGARWPAPSPNGQSLAYGSISTSVAYGDALVVADGDGGHPRTITDTRDIDVQHISWSPDGRLIAFGSIRGLFSRYAINMIDPRGGQQRMITDFDSGAVYGITWAADSRQVIYSYDPSPLGNKADLWVRPIDGGPARRLTLNPRGSFRAVRTSQDGTRLIGTIEDVDYEVWKTPLRGDPASNAEAGVRILDSGWQPMWIQLGRMGALLFNSPATGERNLWSMPLDGSAAPRQITFLSGGRISHASLSPDGSQVSFVSVSAGNGQIWAANADGSNLRQMTSDPSAKAWPFWSPDGKWIMFIAQDADTAQLWKVPTSGGKAEQFTRDGGYRGDWSPAGDRIAYDLNDNRVRIADASSGNVLREVAVNGVNLTSPVWSPDGSLISMHAPAAVWTVPPDSGEPRIAVQFPPGYVYNFRAAWARDGKSLVVNKQVLTSRIVLLENF